jgi:hypothetical protein
MGFCNAHEEEWRTTCPDGCTTEEKNMGMPKAARHIPLDPNLFNGLNVERYKLSKSGKLLFNHPQGTNDDRFWVVALAVYAVEQAQSPPSRPIARII